MRRSRGTARPVAAGTAAPPGRTVFWSANAERDREHWRRRDPRLLARIEALIADIRRSPFSGIGKPEPLKHELAGMWSRRINAEHRLVYRVERDRIYIAQCRYHY